MTSVINALNMMRDIAQTADFLRYLFSEGHGVELLSVENVLHLLALAKQLIE